MQRRWLQSSWPYTSYTLSFVNSGEVASDEICFSRTFASDDLASDDVEGEKKHKKGEGGLNCVLKNFFVPYVEVMFSGSESEEVQSLSEFRVVCSG